MAEPFVDHMEGRLFALFRKEFEMCNVREGERVAVIYDAASRADYVAVSTGALESLGATVFTLHLPGVERGDMPSPSFFAEAREKAGSTVDGAGDLYVGNSPSSEILAAIAPAVDMVVDLVRLHHAPGRVDILKHGARYLTIAERPDALARMLPTEDLKRRVLAGAELLGQANRMYVTSAAGTEVEADVTDTGVSVEYGVAEEPGRYDVWPGGFLATFPVPGSTNGTFVLDVGDMIFHFHKYIESKVKVTVENSYITKVEGDGLDARLISNYLADWGDQECYATSHMGWGLNERAQWNALQFYDKDSTQCQDGRAYAGNFMWSTGPTPHVKRYVPGHFDIPMRGCTLKLDDMTVLENGEIVPEELKP